MRMKVSRDELVRRCDIRLAEVRQEIETLGAELADDQKWRRDLKMRISTFLDNIDGLTAKEADSELYNLRQGLDKIDSRRYTLRNKQAQLQKIGDMRALVTIASTDDYSVSTTDPDMMYIVRAGQQQEVTPPDEHDVG